MVVPAVAVNVTPRVADRAAGAARRAQVEVRVELLNNTGERRQRAR